MKQLTLRKNNHGGQMKDFIYKHFIRYIRGNDMNQRKRKAARSRYLSKFKARRKHELEKLRSEEE